jgi:hypothetical protein
MTDDEKKKKYFYDFGDTEPSDELPPAMEKISDRIAAKKAKIMKQRENHRKSMQLRKCAATAKERGQEK